MSPRAIWRVVRRERVLSTPVFDVRREAKRADDGRRHDFYLLDCPDWVNVVPVTPEGRIVLIELFRHGLGETSLEIPGGMVDPGDAAPIEAAARELREETGYEAETLTPIGVVHPNPALQSNRCTTFLARNARRVGPPRPDEGEDIEVREVPAEAVEGLLRDGRITHALVVAALFWYRLAVEGEGAGSAREE